MFRATTATVVSAEVNVLYRVVLALVGLTLLAAGLDVMSQSTDTCATVNINHAGAFSYTCYDKQGTSNTADTSTDAGVTMSRSTAEWLGIGLGTLALALGTLPWSLYPVLFAGALILRLVRTRRIRKMRVRGTPMDEVANEGNEAVSV
jgi:hypothetical protein